MVTKDKDQEELERLIKEQKYELSLGEYQPPETISGYGTTVPFGEGQLESLQRDGYHSSSKGRARSEYYASCPIHGSIALVNITKCRECDRLSKQVYRHTSSVARREESARRVQYERDRRAKDPEYKKRRDALRRKLEREKYATDPEYREKVKAKNRAAYAKKKAKREATDDTV